MAGRRPGERMAPLDPIRAALTMEPYMNRNGSHSGPASPSRSTDRIPRYATVAAVLAVAAVAGWISYLHCVAVVSANGEPGTVGRWYAVTIDGLIVASSMVILDAARHEETAPRPAWWLLAAGIGATLAVNVLAGVPSGPLGAVVAAWPAFAFVGSFETLMMLVRASARRGVSPGIPAGHLNQDETPEPPAPEAVLLDLVGMGTRSAIADLLGVPRTRVQRWAKELPAVVHGVPETAPADAAGTGAALTVPAVMNGHHG